MRVSVLVIIASFGMLVGQAWGATNLTGQQVRNVCGSGLQSGNGQTGCRTGSGSAGTKMPQGTTTPSTRSNPNLLGGG